ncbi:hypothetical protein HJC23_001642 [Cyclotella cryptica]|uniref:Serine aminopeptidase S33 domain-containing protein n=1 Tax=Cyclotella cryptica TaxID=29204 RepID=A0ABD3QS05_9STRA
MASIPAPATTTPKPRIAASAIISIGITSFILASIWPPLLLAVAIFLSVSIPYSFRVNDSGEARRRLWNEFLMRKDLPEALKCRDVDLEEKYWVNNRGMCLLTSTMIPKDNAPIRGVICLCHGYMDNSSFLKRIEYQRFVKKGFAVVMIEYEGHGRSDGINALIPCWNTMIQDVEQYFDFITRTKFSGKKIFLMGESMGGAVVFDVMNRNRSSYEGVIFVCPMCKVLNTPPGWVVSIFEYIVGAPGSVNSFSVMPIAPSKGDLSSLSFKDKNKKALATSVPTVYGRKPRLATARELLETTKRISSSVHEFDAPFIILHGLEDKVTCPKISEEFYKDSPSKDKSIQLYKGMYHSLTCGETDENVEIVFNDAISWVEARI